eukprot:augustus_masked-scaffold_1-processed-gene-22.16-mRNA-1 protein AED:1.00 eAED:1.00 QI:0/0/0/0/1/1/3/0/1780
MQYRTPLETERFKRRVERKKLRDIDNYFHTFTNFAVSGILQQNLGAVTHIDALHDLVAVTTGRNVHLLRADDTGFCSLKTTVSKFKDTAYSGVISPTGKLLAAGCENGLVALFDVNRKHRLRTFTKHRVPCKIVRWNEPLSHAKTITKLLTSGHDSYTYLWDTATGQPVYTYYEQDSHVQNAQFFDAGKRVLLSFSSGKTILTDTLSNKVVLDFTVEQRIGTSALSLERSLVAVSTKNIVNGFDIRQVNNGKVNKLFSIKSGKKSISSMSFCNLPVESKTQKLESCLVSSSYDGKLHAIKLSDIATTERRMAGFSSYWPEFAVENVAKKQKTADGQILNGHVKATNPVLSFKFVGKYLFCGLGEGFTSSSIKTNFHKANGIEQETVQQKELFHEKEYEKALRKFRYKSALLHALETDKPEVIFAVLDELVKRGSVDAALKGLEPHSATTVFKFLVNPLIVTIDQGEYVQLRGTQIYNLTAFSSCNPNNSSLCSNSDGYLRSVDKGYEEKGINDFIIRAGFVPIDRYLFEWQCIECFNFTIEELLFGYSCSRIKGVSRNYTTPIFSPCLEQRIGGAEYRFGLTISDKKATYYSHQAVISISVLPKTNENSNLICNGFLANLILPYGSFRTLNENSGVVLEAEILDEMDVPGKETSAYSFSFKWLAVCGGKVDVALNTTSNLFRLTGEGENIGKNCEVSVSTTKSCSYEDGSMERRFAFDKVFFFINGAPFNGSVSYDRVISNGDATMSEYLVSTFGWIDPEGHSVFQYSFEYKLIPLSNSGALQTNQTIVLNDFSTNSFAHVYLPDFDATRSELQLGVRCRDERNATSKVIYVTVEHAFRGHNVRHLKFRRQNAPPLTLSNVYLLYEEHMSLGKSEKIISHAAAMLQSIQLRENSLIEVESSSLALAIFLSSNFQNSIRKVEMLSGVLTLQLKRVPSKVVNESKVQDVLYNASRALEAIFQLWNTSSERKTIESEFQTPTSNNIFSSISSISSLNKWPGNRKRRQVGIHFDSSTYNGFIVSFSIIAARSLGAQLEGTWKSRVEESDLQHFIVTAAGNEFCRYDRLVTGKYRLGILCSPNAVQGSQLGKNASVVFENVISFSTFEQTHTTARIEQNTSELQCETAHQFKERNQVSLIGIFGLSLYEMKSETKKDMLHYRLTTDFYVETPREDTVSELIFHSCSNSNICGVAVQFKQTILCSPPLTALNHMPSLTNEVCKPKTVSEPNTVRCECSQPADVSVWVEFTNDVVSVRENIPEGSLSLEAKIIVGVFFPLSFLTFLVTAVVFYHIDLNDSHKYATASIFFIRMHRVTYSVQHRVALFAIMSKSANLAPATKSVLFETKSRSQDKIMCGNLLRQIRINHSLLGCFYYNPFLPRCQRLLICGSTVYSNLFIAAFLFRLKCFEDAVNPMFIIGVSVFCIGFSLVFSKTVVYLIFFHSRVQYGSPHDISAVLTRMMYRVCGADGKLETVDLEFLEKVFQVIISRNKVSTLNRRKQFLSALTKVRYIANLKRLRNNLRRCEKEVRSLSAECRNHWKNPSVNNGNVIIRDLYSVRWQRQVTFLGLYSPRQYFLSLRNSTLNNRIQCPEPVFGCLVMYIGYCLISIVIGSSVWYTCKWVATRRVYLLNDGVINADETEAGLLREWAYSSALGIFISYAFTEPSFYIIKTRLIPRILCYTSPPQFQPDPTISWNIYSEGLREKKQTENSHGRAYELFIDLLETLAAGAELGSSEGVRVGTSVRLDGDVEGENVGFSEGFAVGSSVGHVARQMKSERESQLTSPHK